ncbi:kinetochore protein Spc25 [Drosophila tropicalis]|uniref:kinetochore protein Spc25 n=1 Tax=Drosophila tropicalis TaxID=46794 RepID=UPI0035ABE726
MEPTLNETNNHNYLERMQRLVRNEIKIEIRETELSKRSAKIHQQYLNAKEAVMRQKQEIEKLAQVVADRKREVEDRESFLIHVQTTLDATRKSNASKRNLLEQRKSTVRQHNNALLECMHTLKETTGIYINHGALPDREKGVIMVEDKFIPFNYPAAANGQFWEILNRCGNCNPDKWLNLLTAGPEVEDKVESSRKAHVAESSIIEIDLTSPTNTK